MKYLFPDWPTISKHLKAASHRLYLFDIDGTLASIEKVPEAARIHAPLRRLLYALSVRPRTTVGIISGRRLDDAKAMVGLQHLIYAGNHGLEVCFNGTRRIQLEARHQVAALEIIHRKAAKGFADVPGARVEFKGLSISLHYRLVDKKHKSRFDETLQALVPVIHKENFQLRKGKKVIEILPAGDVGKGTVVKMLVKQLRKPVTIFVGDDVTDESAFEALNEGDVSIRVGHKEASQAGYYLKHQREVKKLLRNLIKL